MKKAPKNKFSKETMEGLIELGAVILKIHNRLVAEGKVKVVDGKIILIK